MKENKKLTARLNELLESEFSAITQYIIQSEMCANWGYKRLHDSIRKQAIDEMKHAEKLIARIIFLGGTPEIKSIGNMHIGKNIEEQLTGARDAETDAIKAYNKGIQLAVELSDEGTAEILRTILADEEAHVDWLETQYEQINTIGIQGYLTEQIK